MLVQTIHIRHLLVIRLLLLGCIKMGLICQVAIILEVIPVMMAGSFLLNIISSLGFIIFGLRLLTCISSILLTKCFGLLLLKIIRMPKSGVLTIFVLGVGQPISQSYPYSPPHPHPQLQLGTHSQLLGKLQLWPIT